MAKGLHITHWSSQDLAWQAVTEGIVPAISAATIRRILHDVDLQPHRTRYWKAVRWDAEFKQRAEKVLWCYSNAPRLAMQGLWHVCVDEIPNCQVLERRPIRRAIPGSIEQQEFEYTRHGTVHILVFLIVHTGQMEAIVVERKDAAHYIQALEQFQQQHRGLKGVFLIQDGDPSHTAGVTDLLVVQSADFGFIHRGFAAKLDAFGSGFQAVFVGAFQYLLAFSLGHGRQDGDHHLAHGSLSADPVIQKPDGHVHGIELFDELDHVRRILAFINNRRGNQNRFGVALQLGCVRFLGTFLSDLSQVPINAQWFVARQLGLTDVAILSTYAQRETTRREHAALIRNQYQYREFTWPWSFRLSRLLYTRSWISNERPSLLFDLATGWFIQHKILLPGASTLTRLISEVRERATNRLWQRSDPGGIKNLSL